MQRQDRIIWWHCLKNYTEIPASLFDNRSSCSQYWLCTHKCWTLYIVESFQSFHLFCNILACDLTDRASIKAKHKRTEYRALGNISRNSSLSTCWSSVCHQEKKKPLHVRTKHWHVRQRVVGRVMRLKNTWRKIINKILFNFIKTAWCFWASQTNYS